MNRRSLDKTMYLLKALDHASGVGEVVATVRQHLAGFGVEAVIAALLPRRNALRMFGQRFLVMDEVPADWRQRYLQRSYARHDPIVAEALRRPTGFGWRDSDLAPIATPLGRQVMDEAAEFGLREGYTVPMITVEGEVGGMSFAGRRLAIAPEHRGMLTLVASYAFGAALLSQTRSCERCPALSARERETLQWAAEGRTDWEIGELMRISEHGVDSHLRAVRAKLGARNRAQAVAAGLRLKLIQ
jgi:LuxR family transcriptional regulator, quorum-sensing system regulator BjaR1